MTDGMKMRLHVEPFRKILTGEKKVECRLYDEKRQGVKVGGEIEFSLRDNPDEKFSRKVVDVRTFATFAEMFNEFPEERVNDVYQYYTPEEEQKFGVVAIVLE